MYEAVGNAGAEREEQDNIQDEEDLPDCLQSMEAIRLLTEKRCDRASRHGTLKPRPGEVVQALLPW